MVIPVGIMKKGITGATRPPKITGTIVAAEATATMDTVTFDAILETRGSIVEKVGQ